MFLIQKYYICNKNESEIFVSAKLILKKVNVKMKLQI